MLKLTNLKKRIQEHAVRFENVMDLGPLLDAAGQARYVLLGEASHGTSEFYSIRAELSKRLIEEKGFNFIAVEGDWPSCYEVNRYIKGYSTYKDANAPLKSFNRWPTWMWANEEVLSLIQWLKMYNEDKQENEKVGFYGIDVYSLWESMEAVVNYLEEAKSPDAEKARAAFSCFEPYHRKPEKYGISSAFYGEDCLQELLDLLQALHSNRHLYEDDIESMLNLEVNTLVAKNAENYYHTMITNDNESWNIRDTHMVDAIQHISKHYGREAKGVIWEHNTHIGDARATDMAAEGLVNVGQLARERYGEREVYSIGFGTYEGTVIAAEEWGAPMKEMTVPKATSGSWEHALHDSGPYNKYIMFDQTNFSHFSDTIGHRAIGVVYNPKYEHLGNYVPSRISERYDAFIHVDKTSALSPLTF